MTSAREAADEDAPAGESGPGARAPGAPPPGRDAGAVGCRVRVEWPEDADWYEAVVRAYSAASGRHNLWYPYDEQARARRGGTPAGGGVARGALGVLGRARGRNCWTGSQGAAPGAWRGSGAHPGVPASPGVQGVAPRPSASMVLRHTVVR
jgi:hypothetical protein